MTESLFQVRARELAELVVKLGRFVPEVVLMAAEDLLKTPSAVSVGPLERGPDGEFYLEVRSG